MGAGVALAMPAMANAVMSAIPPEKAGVGAGINGTLAEFGNGLGVAVLGAVLNSRFAALIPARGGVVARGAGRGGHGRGAGGGSRTRSPPGWRPVSWWARWPCSSGGCWPRRCCAGRSRGIGAVGAS